MFSFTRRLGKVGGEGGFTMLEIIVILAVIAIMAAVLSPMVLNYIDDAKMAKAESDVKTIGKVILTLTKDVQHFPLYPFRSLPPGRWRGRSPRSSGAPATTRLTFTS